MDNYSRALQELAEAGLRRTLREVESPQGARIRIAGRELLNFSSNNYLALANHPRVIEAVQRAVAEWGVGSGASRLVCGTQSPHVRLERRLAAFKQTEAALVFSSGYQANLAAITAGDGDVVLLDKLDHASIIDAARASGATVRAFAHRNYDKLARTLDKCHDYKRRLVVTDSLFSMDGDTTDLRRLVEIKHEHDATLCIDEAHATGIFGEHGRGIAEAQGVEADIDIVVGTLSKAIGGLGGFVCGAQTFIDYLVNTARSFIYTTAPPPAICAAAEAALDIIEAEPQRRQQLLARAEQLRTALRSQGHNVGDSTSQIIPLIIGDTKQTMRCSELLYEKGFFIPAIRPPTVPRNSARLRISLCADHTNADIESLLQALQQCEMQSGS